MRIPGLVVFRSLLSIGLVCAIPSLLCAAGGASSATPAKPKADQTVKIWTNEDVEALGPRFQPTEQGKVETAAANALRAPEASVPTAPERDPRWYAQQLASLESELDAVSTEEGQLRHYRETSTGLQPGLNIYAPCIGVGTDNLIAELDARRQEIEQEIDQLGDTARENSVAPGALVEGRGRVAAESAPTAQQERAQLVADYGRLSNELLDTQLTVIGMRDDADVRHETLLQPETRWGTSMTSNYLRDVYNQQNQLEGQIDAVQDGLRQIGSAQQ
jgi:hypothetical protein